MIPSHLSGKTTGQQHAYYDELGMGSWYCNDKTTVWKTEHLRIIASTWRELPVQTEIHHVGRLI